MTDSAGETSRRKRLKACPQCDTLCHISTKKCADCEYQFYTRRKRRTPKKLADWKTLKRGDKIKVFGGDYYKLGELIIDMSNSGIYFVEHITEEGVGMRGAGGYAFQNMVREGESPSGIIRVIPKIALMKQ